MRWTRATAAIAGGFPIGALPGGFVIWPVSLSYRTNASFDGVPTIVNGIPTLAGWIQYLELIGWLGGLGAIGATVFWLVIKWSGAFATVVPNAPSPPPSRARLVAALAGAAIVASAGVAAIPSITMDRSCHNMFRDGRRSVGPKAVIDLDINFEDWSRLTALLQQFSLSHGMSFRNLSQSRKGVVEVLGISACTGQGLVITADEQLWASHKYAPLIAGRGVPIGVYDLSDDDSWQPLARDLVTALKSEWPDKVRFLDRGGHFVDEPSVLKSQNGSTSAP
jgi:hypothetical protein